MKREVVGVDIGGTNLRAGLVRGEKILNFIRRPTPKDKNLFLKILKDVINEVINENVKNIGVGCPGPLKDGVVLNSPNIPIKNYDLKKFIQKEFGVKCEVENDAKCAGLAELNLGYGKGRKNFFVLTIGTGIGGGVIIDGKLYNKNNLGGELGNIYLEKDRTFESLAGIKLVKRRSFESYGEEMNISELMKMNDKKAREIIEDVSDALAGGIGSLINIFNPEIVVLAGGMREAGEDFLNIVRGKVGNYIFLPKKYEIVWSKLKEPGILGASLLVSN
ncbi:MAG: ROK family protein [Nanoarchaeota archaeon]|nr:ROK family protein [Nanoarchaeota archaeon]